MWGILCLVVDGFNHSILYNSDTRRYLFSFNPRSKWWGLRWRLIQYSTNNNEKLNQGKGKFPTKITNDEFPFQFTRRSSLTQKQTLKCPEYHIRDWSNGYRLMHAYYACYSASCLDLFGCVYIQYYASIYGDWLSSFINLMGKHFLFKKNFHSDIFIRFVEVKRSLVYERTNIRERLQFHHHHR